MKKFEVKKNNKNRAHLLFMTQECHLVVTQALDGHRRSIKFRENKLYIFLKKYKNNETFSKALMKINVYKIHTAVS